jgi:hypothetical protein
MIYIQKPTIYTEAAFDLVLLLNQSGWFLQNNIDDPRPALNIFTLMITKKYENTELPDVSTLFANEELEYLKKTIGGYANYINKTPHHL